MSLNIALNNAVSGLRLNQSSMDLAAQNVANVNTEGYTRKIIVQKALVLGGIGSGVDIEKISRNVDEYILKDMRTVLSQVSDTRVQDQFYDRLQNLFGSLASDSSISAFVSELGTRFQALVNAPEDQALRSEVASQADLLSQQVRSLAASLQDIRLAADQDITDAANEVQTNVKIISELNVKISRFNALNLPTVDLEDQRDNAINAISEMMGVNYFRRNSGEIVLMSEAGRLMVDRSLPTFTHNSANLLDTLISWNNGGSGIANIDLNGTDITAEIATGRIAGLIAMRDTVIPNLASQLEELADTIQFEVNSLHNKGTSFPGYAVMTGQRNMLGTEQPAWTGTLRVSVTDATGANVETKDINLAGFATVDLLIADINAMGNLTATRTNGKLVIKPTNIANKVAVAEMDSAVPLGNRTVGAAAFFGLNDLFTNGAEYDVYSTNYQASRNTALGIAGALTFRIGAQVIGPVNYVAGDTLDGIRDKINLAMAGLVPANAIAASVDPDGSGFRMRITADTSAAGIQNFFVSDSNASGFLSTANLAARDGRLASTMDLRADIKTDTSLIAHGQLASLVAPPLVGAIAINNGDNTTIQAIANRFKASISFPPTGLLGGSSRTLEGYGAQIVSLNSTQARNISDLRKGREFLIENLQNNVSAVSGVNLDEEMANLIVLQNAYAGSARVIDVTRQLFDLLSDVVR